MRPPRAYAPPTGPSAPTPSHTPPCSSRCPPCTTSRSPPSLTCVPAQCAPLLYPPPLQEGNLQGPGVKYASLGPIGSRQGGPP